MFGLNPTHQRALFRLRARLLWRQFSGEKGRLVGAIVALLVFGPMVVGLAFASALGYLRLDAPWPAQILGGVLVLLWLVWAVFPVLVGPVNTSIDVSRLLVYPIGRRDLAAGVLIGTLLDYPTFLALPLFAAVAVGWGFSSALPMVIVALPLAYLHMVIIGQIVTTAAGGILQSRRFRDLSIIIFSLLGASCYFISQGITRLAENLSTNEAFTEFFRTWRPLDQLQWLPTGALARAIEQAGLNQWGAALLWLAYALVWLVVLGRLWLWLLERLMTGQGFLLPSPAAGRRRTDERPRGRRGPQILPPQLQALVLKELRLTWRIPQRRIGLLQSFIVPVIMGGVFFFGGDWDGDLSSSFVGLSLPAFAYFTALGFASNGFSWEGRGLAMLFLTPVERPLILQAKVLAALPLATAPLLVITAALLFFSEPLPLLTGLFVAIALVGTTTAVAMFFSIWFPFPVNLDTKRPFSRPERRGGFIPSLMNVVGIPAASGLLSLPFALPIALVWWFERPALGLLTAALTLAYGLALPFLASRPAGSILLKREPEILEALRTPEGD